MQMETLPGNTSDQTEHDKTHEQDSSTEFVWVVNTARASSGLTDPTVPRDLSILDEYKIRYGDNNVKLGESLNPRSQKPSIVPGLSGIYVRKSAYDGGRESHQQINND